MSLTNSSFILKSGGILWACGSNYYGQLGLGDTTNRYTFTQVDVSVVKQVDCGDAHIFILKHDGTLWSCGYNNYGQLGLGDTTNRSTFTQVDVSDVKQIICGTNHTMILKK